MFVYEDGYRCASCGAKGSLEKLAKKVGSHFQLTRSQSKSNILPRWSKWQQQYGDLECIVEHAHKSLLKFKQFQGYFKKRKVEDFIEPGMLGYLDGWATIPVFDNKHKIVDLVVRAISGKGDSRYVVSPQKNALRPLFCPNWGIVEQTNSPIYVVYGIMDAISLYLAGYKSITGITGQSLSYELLQPLHKRFIIIPDYNEEKSAHNLSNKLGWRSRVKELKWLDGTKDINDVVVKYGYESLKGLLA
jgi:hypothetical protein